MNEDIKNNKLKVSDEIKKIKKKRTRKRKRTKAQEEKREKILSLILNKWVYVQQNWGEEDNFIFLKHRIPDGGSFSKIEQILLSGDELQDGVYLITDYEVDMVYDHKIKREIVDLKPKKFDKKTGFDAEEDMVESFDELKNKLIGAKYLTESEFLLYCQNNILPKNIEEMRLSFSDYNEDKE